MTIENSSSLPSSLVRALDRRTQIRLVAGVAVALVLLVLICMGIRALLTPGPSPAPALPPGAFRPTAAEYKQLTITPVAAGSTAELVRASGSISADADHSTPVLLPFSGQVTRVMVEAGEYVRQGQPLLSVASPELVDARNALTAATAQQASATEALRVAQANAVRQKAIYETAGGALKDFNQAQNDLATAQAALRTAQSAARTAGDHLAIFGKSAAETHSLATDHAIGGRPTTLYRAPVSGLIADRSVAPGQFIAAGGSAPLLTITDPSHVWLVAQLPESEAANVRLGDQVVVTTPALPGRSFTATIDNIGASLDPATHRLPVRATISNPGNALKPQMFAAFAIRRQLSVGGGVLVPANAVIHEGEGARVWVAGRDGLLYGRPVETGETEGGLTRITRGLLPNDRVVTAGAIFVNEAGLDQ